MIVIVTLTYKNIRKPAWPDRAPEAPTRRRGQGAQYKVKTPCREVPAYGRGLHKILMALLADLPDSYPATEGLPLLTQKTLQDMFVYILICECKGDIWSELQERASLTRIKGWS